MQETILALGHLCRLVTDTGTKGEIAAVDFLVIDQKVLIYFYTIIGLKRSRWRRLRNIRGR